MKKLFYLFLMVGLIAVSCNKAPIVPSTQDVIFKAATATTGFKADDCNTEVAHYAAINIDGTDYTVDVFYLDGVIYTNTLKLAPGNHTVNTFVLKNDNDTPNDLSDDIIVKATPLIGSAYAGFVQHPLAYDFNVDAFFKAEVNIEILCFEATDITNFGFAWFAVNEITVREFVFFGDFCTKYYADYAGSLYAGQSGGLRHDMPAIFKVDVYNDNGFLISYNNEGWLGEGAPLKVQFPDFDNSVDDYTFKLSILVKVGTGFEYKEFATWTSTDNGGLNEVTDLASDGVYDFVLGSCVPDADVILPPYMNLPATVTLKTGGSTPGSLGTYFDVTLSNVGTGFDIADGKYGVYCADKANSINLNTTYNGMNVFSTLYLQTIPTAFDAQKPMFDNINWLGNNLYRYDGHNWADIQDAVWMMLGQLTSSSRPIANQMKTDALAYGDGYLPPVGGYAAVLFADPTPTTDPVLQLLFTLVDP